jgi:hypothetical protein
MDADRVVLVERDDVDNADMAMDAEKGGDTAGSNAGPVKKGRGHNSRNEGGRRPTNNYVELSKSLVSASRAKQPERCRLFLRQLFTPFDAIVRRYWLWCLPCSRMTCGVVPSSKCLDLPVMSRGNNLLCLCVCVFRLQHLPCRLLAHKLLVL